MEQRYGIHRLVLLNTAGYSLGMFPMECPVSIYGANNHGKSAAINALQFPFIANLKGMNFGDYSLEQSKKFYFASDTSYILVEVLLSHGTHVIGVVGKGPGGAYGHQFFVYQGQLELKDYQKENRCLPLKALFAQLQSRGLEPREVKPDELRRLLTGGKTQTKLNLTMIPLRNPNEHYLNTFRELFLNLLYLKGITSIKIKALLLDVFNQHLKSSTVDYIAACEEAFRPVRRMQSEFEALKAVGDSIERLKSAVDERQGIRGKLHRINPIVDITLGKWHEHYKQKMQELENHKRGLQQEQKDLQKEIVNWNKQSQKHSAEKQRLDDWFSKFNKLKQKFELVANLTVLEQHAKVLKEQYEQCLSELGSAKSATVAQIKQRLGSKEKQYHKIETQINNLGNNVYSRLRDDFSQQDIQQLARMLNYDLLSLPVGKKTGSFQIDNATAMLTEIRVLLSRLDGNQFQGSGYRIDLSPLNVENVTTLGDKPLLMEQLENVKQELQRLQKELKIANDLAAKQKEADALDGKLKSAEQKVADYKDYLECQKQAEEKRQQWDQNEKQLRILNQDIASQVPKSQAISDKISRFEQEKGQLNIKNNQITEQRKKRKMLSSSLPQGKPYYDSIDDSIDNCLSLLMAFNEAYAKLNKLDNEIDTLYALVRAKGVTKFDSQENEDEKLALLIRAYDNLDSEELTIKKANRAAVTNIARTLSNIRSDYNRLESELNNFNRAINRHPISNLDGFKVRLEPNKAVLNAIDQIIETADNYESGDNLNIFDIRAKSNDEKAEHAKEYLSEMVQKRGNQLKLEDLFELAFEITQNNKSSIYTEIDGAASTGTTMTIKIFTNMYLIRHLMDKREADKFRWPFYLDEAANIDDKNQKAFIETALNLGFVPVLASVKPQTTANYLIDIEAGIEKEGIYIDEEDWKKIEELTDDKPND
jgi:hypothetical protein